MKKLFLASFASVSLDLVKDLLPKPAHELKAVFIPTAGDLYENKEFVHVDKVALMKTGMQVVDVDLKTTQGDELVKALKHIDVILVAGGNTFYLLDWVKRSGFDKIVKSLIEKGVIYIGSSAGSVLCGPTIEVAKRFDDPAVVPNLTHYEGLNLIDFVIIPHVQKEKYKERIDETVKEMESRGYDVQKLTDNQAVVINGDDIRVVGSVTS